MGQSDRRRRRVLQLAIAIGAVAAGVCVTVLVMRRPDVPGPDVAAIDVYEPAGTYKPTPADAGVREKLKSPIAGVDFEGVELREAIEKLREISGVKIRVNWPALAKERVTQETSVNVRLTNVAAGKVIRILLDDVSWVGAEREDEGRLGYVVEDGAVTISSQSELAGHSDVREYDIRDLVASVEEFRNQFVGNPDSGLDAELRYDPEIITNVSPPRADETVGRESWREASEAGEDTGEVGLFDPGSGSGSLMTDEQITRAEIVDEMITLLSYTVDRESWRNSGGSVGEVHEAGGRLVVTQSVANHESITELLADIRRGLKNRGGDSGPDKRAKSEIATGDRLAAKIAEIDFDEIELEKAIDFIRDKSGVNIHVKWRTLARERLKRDTRISVSVKDATFAEAIQAVCNDLSGGEPDHGLFGAGYIVSDGVVTISTKLDLWRDVSFRAYDIGEMISLIAVHGSKRQSYEEITDSIKSIIVDAFARDCWCPRNMGLHSISEIGGLFVITRPIENHEPLTRLLGELHAGLGLRGRATHWPAMTPRDRLARKKLGAKVPKFCAEDMPLRQVIEFFRDASGVAVNVDWRALALEAIEPETPINIFFPSEIACGRALEIALASLGDERSTIEYVVMDGGLTISTREGLRGREELRMYDIRDLVALVRKNGQTKAAGAIHHLISDTVAPDSWRAAGESGEMHELGGLVVITQTVDNHHAIAELLGDLREHFKTRNLDAGSHVEPRIARAVGKQLEAKIPKLDIDMVGCRKAIEALCDDPGLDLYVNWHSFAGDVSIETIPVIVHLENVTLREAIDAVFDSANKGASIRTSYAIEGGAMWIVPEGSLRYWHGVRIYDARDIIARKMKTAPAADREKVVEAIVNRIRKTIDPESWCEEGGYLGNIYEIGGLLVVGQAYRNHESLAALMTKLRAEK